jgi:hypothetical protein
MRLPVYLHEFVVGRTCVLLSVCVQQQMRGLALKLDCTTEQIKNMFTYLRLLFVCCLSVSM